MCKNEEGIIHLIFPSRKLKLQIKCYWSLENYLSRRMGLSNELTNYLSRRKQEHWRMSKILQKPSSILVAKEKTSTAECNSVPES